MTILLGEEAITKIFRHADPDYDPQKAKEYYERTKHLKGRKKGSAIESSGRRPVGAKTPTVKVPNRAAEHKAAQVARVRELTERLKKLRAIYKKLIDAAKRRSGVEVKPDPAEKDAAGKDKKSSAEDLSAAEKRKKSIAAKKAYEKEHPDKAVEALDKQVAAMVEKIKEARAKLKEAIAAETEKKVAAPKPTPSKAA